MILSLFCGCGGLDLGFELSGFETGLALDRRPHSVSSWNYNRPDRQNARVADISNLSVDGLDLLHGRRFEPRGVVGGPPCQSFTRANHRRSDTDKRSELVVKFFDLAMDLHRSRRKLDFIVMENVAEVAAARGGLMLDSQVSRLRDEGFGVEVMVLNASSFGVPQHRTRLFLVAVHEDMKSCDYRKPSPVPQTAFRTVRQTIGKLPTPSFYSTSGEPNVFHANHWCMNPKSAKFFDGSLKEGRSSNRSFKTLRWDAPSIAVSYGHREVHVHPDGKRRLSVFEAMQLQGFPVDYCLLGPLSAQIDQVSEAVPPPLAYAVASSVARVLTSRAGRKPSGHMELLINRTHRSAAEELSVPASALLSRKTIIGHSKASVRATAM